MSIYPSPKQHNGALNTIFNNTDYINTSTGSGSGGVTLTQTDSRYLKNSGIVVSSAQTTFNSTVNIAALCTVDNINVITLLDASSVNVTGLCTSDSIKVNALLDATNVNVSTLATIDTLTVENLLKAKQSSDTLISDIFRSEQVYSFTNGMVYSMISDTTAINSISFINIPTTINQTYIFTFILQPSTLNSPYYIKSIDNSINVNGISTPLYGLQNVSLPANYTFLVQQISIIYDLYSANPPIFFALTSVSAY
jgi:hypothetical protein